MNNRLKLMSMGMSIVALNGCAMTYGGDTVAYGLVYSGYKSSGEVGTATPAKTGEACVSSILGLVATGDASVERAKKAGGITQVAHVDHEQTGILGIYAKSCTIVYGQ